MKHLLYLSLIALTIACRSSQPLPTADQAGHDWRDEVIYHVMPRSFHDSDGDRHGDLRGFTQKLDYLEALGVTTILFTPLYESGFYHNYFPTDYEKIDPEYGTMEDYLAFVEAVHASGMKFLMDMETQYAQGEHRWFRDSYQNPSSPYSDFIYYSDSLNRYPEQIFLPSRSDLYYFKAWPQDSFHIVFLDLNRPRVREWMSDFYAFWVDPNGDGDFTDGVDGFRIDHIMDDLDYKGIFTNMYQDVWRPIFARCKTINPRLFIVGEQADWTQFGDQMVRAAGIDAAFGFPLRFAVAGEAGVHDMYGAGEKKAAVKLNPDQIHKAVLETMQRFPPGAYSINFLENHDTDRWATLVGAADRLKYLGAVLNILLPGLPSIYYGQELGVTGRVGNWGFDANHLPVREAFPWTPDPTSPGTAVFYKDTGPWWEQSFFRTGEAQGFALSEQINDTASLWRHYQMLIELRKKHPAFRYGDYQPILTEDKRLLAFSRQWKEEKVIVLINVTDELIVLEGPEVAGALGIESAEQDQRSTPIPPYDFMILDPVPWD